MLNKRFVHSVSIPEIVPNAYEPCPPLSANSRKILGPWHAFGADVRRIACTLAHRVLMAWGRMIISDRIEVLEYTLPEAEDILRAIFNELKARTGGRPFAESNLILVVGHEIMREIDDHTLASGMGVVQFNRPDPRDPSRYRREVYGVPVLLSPWLQPGEWVVLPVNALEQVVGHLGRYPRRDP